MVLRNHGLLIVGTSVAAAFLATYRMERACAMQLAFQQSGAEFHPIGDEVVSAAFDNAGVRPAAAAMIRPNSNGRPSCASSTASTRPTSNSYGDYSYGDYPAGRLAEPFQLLLFRRRQLPIAQPQCLAEPQSMVRPISFR
jgi:hypothetical protein